jgi:hypothetical protein
MTYFHLILSFLELALLAVYGVCVFYQYNKRWNFLARFLITIIIIVINIVQLGLEIMLEKNFVLSMIMIFMWGMNLLRFYLEIKRKM